jgi:hypothetical protein
MREGKCRLYRRRSSYVRYHTFLVMIYYYCLKGLSKMHDRLHNCRELKLAQFSTFLLSVQGQVTFLPGFDGVKI